MTSKLKLHIWPPFGGEDKGEGGVRRVVEAQRKDLPREGIDIVDDPGDADVIAAHISLPGAYLKKFPDKPIVAHCHGLYWSEYDWDDWAYKANRDVLQAIAVADVVTAPSEWVAQVIRRHSLRDVRVIPHGIDRREWQPAASHRGYVLWNKNRPDPVCDPADPSDLARMLPDVPFVQTFAKEARDGRQLISENVTLTGRLTYEESKSLVRNAGVYLATTRETFGIGTLEAMAAGVPVVGWAYGAQPEIIREGEGILVRPGDFNSLAAAVRHALANREEIGKKGRERAKDFPWSVPAKAYRDLYHEVAERYEKREAAPRTSIIVTAYNLEKYLPAALESVAAQTDDSWECIVVDDASPDGCGAIADEWEGKDRRFRAIHNPSNLYLAEARNRGIEEATGRYILPLDADDMLTPYAVQTLADALDEDRTLSVAYGGVQFREEDGETLSTYGPKYSPGSSGWPVPFEAPLQLSGANLLPYSSLFRREAWALTGGYRGRLRTSEDADFWTRLTSFGFRAKMVTTSDTLIYRNRPGSMSRENEAKRHDYIRWYPWARKASAASPGMIGGPQRVSLFEPKVAVIIPVGPGHERLVIDAIDSVVSQTYPYWECIVVNDSGSELAGLPSFVRIVQSDSRDAGAARNAGIRAATAPLFLPLDADDYLQPEALGVLVKAQAQTRNIVYPDFYEDPEAEGQFRTYTLPDWDCRLLTRKGCLHSITALTPVEVWEMVGGYREGVNWEDWDFQLRCANAGVCSSRVALPLFTYRKHTGMRRHYDAEEFERRKADILEHWQPYFSGEKTLAGCGCRGNTVKVNSSPVASANGNGKHSDDAVMVEYVGNRQGKMRFRGPSGTVYPFAAGSGPQWVRGVDAATFTTRPDFVLATPPVADAPVLMA